MARRSCLRSRPRTAIVRARVWSQWAHLTAGQDHGRPMRRRAPRKRQQPRQPRRPTRGRLLSLSGQPTSMRDTGRERPQRAAPSGRPMRREYVPSPPGSKPNGGTLPRVDGSIRVAGNGIRSFLIRSCCPDSVAWLRNGGGAPCQRRSAALKVTRRPSNSSGAMRALRPRKIRVAGLGRHLIWVR